MTQAIVYTTPVCPYCVRAKKLLEKRGISYEEIDISQDPELRDTMIEKSGGRRTVPQIFIGDKHVGGFDDLHALDVAGKLDALLTN